MNKKYNVFFMIFFIINVIKIEARVLFSPSINDWLWYSGTIEYPLDFYFYNKRLNFCWDVGVSYLSRYADLALNCNFLELGTNLALLFHGSDNFILNDFQPISNNIIDAGLYEFLPHYVFNETSCQINLQVSRDFQYSNEKYIHSTVRCIIPFAKQSVVNIASGNMYYNTPAENVKMKSYRKNNNMIRKKNNACKQDRDSSQCVFGGESGSSKTTLSSPYIQTKEVDGKSLFAIQGTYFTQPNQSIFTYIQDQIDFPYVAFNKNLAPGSYLDDDGNDLSLDAACHSYSLTSIRDNVSLFSQLMSANDENSVVGAAGEIYEVQNTPFSSGGISPGSALVTFYSYGDSLGRVENSFYVNDPYGISYSLATEPDYISDVNIGDLVSSASIVYGNGLTGDINQTNLSQNTILKVVATGPYGQDNPYLSSLWERDSVEFIVPPVVVQYSNSGFPFNFGFTTDLRKLKQPYKSSVDGSQFEFYGDFLKNNVINNSPKITLLNADGTFYDPTANCALLWYNTDYSKLFNNPSDPNIIQNLNNIYITSSINPELNTPTQASSIIYDKIGNNPTPDSCCNAVANWVKECIYKPIVKNMNTNFTLVQDQIWSLVNVGNSVVGNQSPLSDSKPDGVLIEPQCQNWENYYDNKEDGVLVRKNIQDTDTVLKGFIDSATNNFKNGKYSSMQYNGFNQSGLGNLLIEWLLGSYFLENSSLLDFYLALECPTAAGINNDKSYLAVGIGNNGHYVGRVGFQGFIDFDTVLRFRVSSKMYLEHGFSGYEKLVPQLDGYAIFGIIPVKMDTQVSWDGGLFYIDGSFYTNDYSGLTFSYQYWKKEKDAIQMLDPVNLAIPNTEEVLGCNFDGATAMSMRKSHTCGLTFFSRLTNECFFNCGLSRVFAGENIPQLLDMFMSIGISY